MDPLSEYRRRIERWDAAIARAERAHLLFSNLRLATVFAGAVLFWFVFIRNAIPAWWIAAPVVVFGALAVRHARVLQQRDRARRARRVYERGIERINDRWAGTGRDGARFMEGHSFARDLDLFGRGSLFELLNTTRTDIGEETLADWLRSPASASDVVRRQSSVDELRPMLDFREDAAVLAAESEVGRTGPLAAWTAAPSASLSCGAGTDAGGVRRGHRRARGCRVPRRGRIRLARRLGVHRGGRRVVVAASGERDSACGRGA